MRESLEKKWGEPQSARLTWQPRNSAPVDEEQARLLLKMLDTLEDNDDVQEVFANYEIAEDIMERLSA